MDCKTIIIALIILIIVVLLFTRTSSKQSEEFTTGCKYNSNCKCGKNCKCGPNCNCGEKFTTKQKSCTTLNDDICRKCENVFKKFDPNATILPGIGLPSQNNGVCTILHGMPGSNKLKINGLESSSPLANAALFSTECAQGKTLNLYEMMLPEGLSSIPGEKSNVEKYVEELNDSGINVAGSHWHWWASDPYVAAIHHQNVGMNPIEFTTKTINALSKYKQRMDDSH
jgi:hypothetical protein